MFMDAYVSDSALNRKQDEPVTPSFLTLHKKHDSVRYLCGSVNNNTSDVKLKPDDLNMLMLKSKSLKLKCTKQLFKKLL